VTNLPLFAAATAAGSALMDGRGTYDDVIRYAERLFAKIRQAVACQQCPTTLKAAFLDPVQERLALEVQLELFAKPDAEFMGMFTGELGSWCSLGALLYIRHGCAMPHHGISMRLLRHSLCHVVSIALGHAARASVLSCACLLQLPACWPHSRPSARACRGAQRFCSRARASSRRLPGACDSVTSDCHASVWLSMACRC
jgi:hypothetical protein